MAMPRSVATTSISSPGPHSVVTSCTITGIRSRKEGIARMVHPEARQFCQPPMPCSRRPSEWVTTLALKLVSTSVAPRMTASTIAQESCNEFGDAKTVRGAGDLGASGNDFRGIADRVYLDNIIHVVALNL